MMKSLTKIGLSILAMLIVIAALLVGIYWATISVWDALSSVDAKLAVGVVAAATTVLGATLTVTIGKYLERKHAVEAAFRERKVEIYDGFLQELFKLFGQEGIPDDTGLANFIRDWQRKLIVWGGSKVLLTYIEWRSHLSRTSNEPDAETIYLMGEFLLSMRKDLGLSNKGIDRGVFAHMILRNPDLFFEMASKDPNVTFAEIASQEKNLDGPGT